jgi:uncharacterized protein YlxW (UPF0749 family)
VTRDATLSLLERVVSDALDPGYHELAEHPRPRSTSWVNSVVMAVLVGVMAVLVVAAVLQVRDGAPGEARTRADLASRVSLLSSEVDALEQQVSAVAGQVETYRSDALGGGTDDDALSDELAALEARVGSGPAAGPGVEVVLDDGRPSPAGEGGPDLARVLDTDIQLTVNGLFAAGADAVAVNDQRITVLSPIRSAGEAVLVGFRPLTPPYRVVAVGPTTMADTFDAGPARAELRQLEATYGMQIDVDELERVTVPGRSDLRARYAKEREAS